MLEMIKDKKREEGFTLIELLIVVAIIAILVAISIPIISGITDNAKKQADVANVRAAKAQFIIQVINNDQALPGMYYAYNAQTGKVVEVEAEKGEAYGQMDGHKGKWIFLQMPLNADGTRSDIEIGWGTTSALVKIDPDPLNPTESLK